MFNFFRKRSKSDAYSLEVLSTYANKDKYFVRVAHFMKLNFNQCTITVIDPHGPRMITMDPWPETIFLNATGKRTVRQYIEETAGSYNGRVPSQLDSFIISELEKLVFEYRIIELTDVPNTLKPQFEEPIPGGNK
ncbi:hypothetical protein SAMN05518672_103561 [Chitinophaga sp. CF118]|uniref:hypothetical protein n=1 Tax=Chitinophaga sp. CF118 TaxID=1884367 RepID=UPI0008DFF075|nr:hypothetical protein [Chitinophaga sp. CF118]SFD86095.1 hypothetical protein SAMN05518672_103561 [Chitinophaga sp. CF118]